MIRLYKFIFKFKEKFGPKTKISVAFQKLKRVSQVNKDMRDRYRKNNEKKVKLELRKQ
jgi:hypothetical protein